MVKIDLITGFLGSGKTTFMKEYGKYLISQGENICILENDFGAVNVDMMLLQDMEGDQCELEMIAGGCDYDCHKRRFKTKLISMAMWGYDRVIVEPSGIFDVEEFFDVLREEPLEQWYEIGNVVSIVDANLENNLSDASTYLLASQVSSAGCLVFSHVNEGTKENISQVKIQIKEALQKVKSNRKNHDIVIEKAWSDFTQEDWKSISHAGYVLSDMEKQFEQDSYSFESLYFMNVHLSRKDMEANIKQIFSDKACGNIFRIKGFLKVGEEEYIEINATQKGISIQPISKGQEVLIIIGENLNKDKIQSYGFEC